MCWRQVHFPRFCGRCSDDNECGSRCDGLDVLVHRYYRIPRYPHKRTCVVAFFVFVPVQNVTVVLRFRL